MTFAHQDLLPQLHVLHSSHGLCLVYLSRNAGDGNNKACTNEWLVQMKGRSLMYRLGRPGLGALLWHLLRAVTRLTPPSTPDMDMLFH